MADWKKILIPDLSPELCEKFKRVRLLALDSDGVLTDGGVYVADNGHEFRRFNIKDGLGLKRVLQAGLHVAIISSASCEAVRVRATQLGIENIYLGVPDKLTRLSQLCEQLEIDLGEVAYIGDDLPDLQVLNLVGIGCAPADAVEEVKNRAKYVSSKPGGAGAVREICDLLAKDRLLT